MSALAMALPEQNHRVCEICDYLNDERIILDLAVSSKKRLLEEMAGLLTQHNSKLNKDTIFQVLLERERLGSTGIGEGVVLPHGRVNGITEPLMAVARLKNPLDVDAPDDKPVMLVIALLVPAEADETHLQILSKLAAALNQETRRERFLGAVSKEEIYRVFDKV